MIASRTNIGEDASLTLGDVFYFALQHSEAMAGRLGQGKDAKDASQKRPLLVERQRDELMEYVWSLKDRVNELRVAKGPLDAAVVALSIEPDSLKAVSEARDAYLERVQVTANAKSDFVELLKDRLEQERTSLGKRKAALEAQLAEAKSQPDAALTETKNQRDCFRDKVDRLSSDWSVLDAELKTTRCQLCAAKSEAETISGQVAKLQRMKEETEQTTSDVQYNLDGATKAKISQFEGREGRAQEGVDRILSRVGWMKAGIDRVRDQLVQNLQLDLQNYVTTAFAALKAPTRRHCRRLGRSIHVDVNSSTDGLKALIETVEGLCGLSANGS